MYEKMIRKKPILLDLNKSILSVHPFLISKTISRKKEHIKRPENP